MTPAPQRRIAPPAAVAVSPPAAVAAQPEQPPAAQVPQLAPMLTGEEQRSYDAVINELVGRSQQNIGRAKTRNLSAQERDMIARAEAFLTQAQQVRRTDPAAAKSLAERAELLSREAAGQ